MKNLASLLVILALLIVCISIAICQNCPAFDPSFPMFNPPTLASFTPEFRQNYVNGTKTFTLGLNNFPVYIYAGEYILTRPFDTTKPLSQQVMLNNVDGQSTCSLNPPDRSVSCADYKKQFSNINYRTFDKGCLKDIQIELNWDQFMAAATFNIAKQRYELSIYFGWYIRTNQPDTGKIYQVMGSLVTFSVAYNQYGDEIGKPSQLTTEFDFQTVRLGGSDYAFGRGSFLASANDTVNDIRLQLKVSDKGVTRESNQGGTLTCFTKQSDLSNSICEFYTPMKGNEMSVSLTASGSYCNLNGLKNACDTKYPMTTPTFDYNFNSFEAKTDVQAAASQPILWLSKSYDIASKCPFGSADDVYAILSSNTARAQFTHANMRVTLTAGKERFVKNLNGRMLINYNPLPEEIPLDIRNKTTTIMKFPGKDGYFAIMERPLAFRFQYDLVPRGQQASRYWKWVERVLNVQQEVDSQYNTEIEPESAPQVAPDGSGNAFEAILAFIRSILEFFRNLIPKVLL